MNIYNELNIIDTYNQDGEHIQYKIEPVEDEDPPEPCELNN